MIIRIKKHLLNYAIGYIFFISQSIVYISHLFPSSLIIYNFPINNSLSLHILLTIIFLIGYIFFKKKNTDNSKKLTIISSYFYIIGFFVSIVGLIVTIWQVSITIDPIKYLKDIFSGDFDINIREAFGLSSENGGLSGFIKMFHIIPLGVFLMSSSHLSLSNLPKRQRKKLSFFIALIVLLILIKILFSLDRLSILALIIGIAFLFKDKIFSPITIFIFFIIFFIGNYISSLRLDGYNLFDFVILYSKGSLVNFELMILSNSNLTFGFSTFFHPILYFFEGLRISIPFPSSTFNWVWNPAQYFYSNLFQDFRYVSLFVIFFLGAFSRFLEIRSRLGNPIFTSFYLLILFIIGTFITVPFIRAPEFWFISFIIFYLSLFFQNKKLIF